MKKLLTVLVILTLSVSALYAQRNKKERSHYIEISSDYGNCLIRLYNQTPLHRDNMLKLVNNGFYNGILFHRVIEHFMIQAGDPNSKTATKETMLGEGQAPGERIPAEFDTALFHKKGVLAAARDNNPKKASSTSHFYIVQGKTFSDAGLDSVEKYRLNGYQIPEYQRQVYKTIGGTPQLDQNYTVFGEVLSGLDVVDKIAAVKTDKNDRPVTDIPMQIRELKKREVRRLERKLRKQNK